METLHIVIDTLLWAYLVITLGTFGLAYRQWKKRQKDSSSVEKMFQQWGGRDNASKF